MNNKPNFLIIMSDQHQPDAISGLQHPVVQTPNLDALMQRGLTFNQAYCNAPICTPARASFLTGLLTPQHGVWDLSTPVRSDQPTFAHVLRKAGYHTVYCGREHFIGPDLLHGFEYLIPKRISYQHSGNYGDWEAPLGDDLVMDSSVKNSHPTEEMTSTQKVDKIRTELAIEELEKIAREKTDQPWAMMVGLMLPHFPYEVSKDYYNMYNAVSVPVPRPAPNEGSYGKFIPDMLGEMRTNWLVSTNINGITDEDIRRTRQSYYGMITCMDEYVGKIINSLEKLGLADNTWIIYLSDHGENLGEHGLFSKCNFYQDSVRIPLIIIPPGGQKRGSTCSQPVSQIDWLPTVMELIGEEGWDEKLPGRSLCPLIEDPSREWPNRPVIADYGCVGVREPMRMVRFNQWSAWFSLNSPPVLFDLSSDPYEWHDLGSSAKHAEILKTLEKIARNDGWDPAVIKDEIILAQKRQKYIRQAADRGDTFSKYVEGALEKDEGMLKRFYKG